MSRQVDESTSRRGEPRRLGDSTTRRLLLVAAILFVALAFYIRLGPIDPALLDRTKHQSATILDRHGEILYEPLAASGNRAEWIVAVPPMIENATLAAEDRRFYRHPGIDPLSIARATWRNVRAMHVVEGGSTITQQVAKLLLQSKERSLREKCERSRARAAARASLHEARDPRALSESRAVRQSHQRRRAREPRLLRRGTGESHAGAGGVSGVAAAASERVQSAARSRSRACAAATHPRAHDVESAAARGGDARAVEIHAETAAGFGDALRRAR